MKKYLKLILVFLTLLSLFGCEKKQDSGIGKIHWDRDMCKRCVMVISDRHNAVQVQNPDTFQRYIFDDIGCMVLWFEDEHISWSDGAIIWVTDVNSGEFIDARKAFFTTNNVTPMAYGFSAHKSKGSIKKGEEIITYSEVKKRIIETSK